MVVGAVVTTLGVVAATVAVVAGAVVVVAAVVVGTRAACTTRTTGGGVPVGTAGRFSFGTFGSFGGRAPSERRSAASDSSSCRFWAEMPTGLTEPAVASPSCVVRNAANAPAATANETATAITSA